MIWGGPPPDDGVMNRFLAISYGAFSYVLFLVVFVYAILFVGGIAVPHSVDDAVRAPAQRDGAAGVQAVVDSLRPRRDRTQYLCSVGESGSGPAALAVAVDYRRGLGGVVNPGAASGVGAVLARLGHRVGVDVHGQPLRAVRAEAGVRRVAGPAAARDRLPHDAVLSGRAPSAEPGLHRGVLGGADHDGGPSAVRGGHDGVDPASDAVGGTRPRRGARHAVRRVPAAGSHADPDAAQARH